MLSEFNDETSNGHNCIVDVDRLIVLVEYRTEVYNVASKDHHNLNFKLPTYLS